MIFLSGFILVVPIMCYITLHDLFILYTVSTRETEEFLGNFVLMQSLLWPIGVGVICSDRRASCLAG